MALVFNMKDINPGTWYDLGQGARIKIRVTGANDYRQIEKACTRKLSNGTKEIDVDKRNDMLMDFSIVDWEVIIDEENNPIECTTENKKKLYQSPTFSKFISSKVQEVAEQELIVDEVLVDNLDSFRGVDSH
jgi:hypothetical protein